MLTDSSRVLCFVMLMAAAIAPGVANSQAIENGGAPKEKSRVQPDVALQRAFGKGGAETKRSICVLLTDIGMVIAAEKCEMDAAGRFRFIKASIALAEGENSIGVLRGEEIIVPTQQPISKLAQLSSRRITSIQVRGKDWTVELTPREPREAKNVQPGQAPARAQTPEPIAVQLKKAEAVDLVNSLNPLVGKGRGIKLVAEPISNAVLVTAPTDRREQVLRVITDLDALSGDRQYTVELCVCQGDPLSDKSKLTILSRPTLAMLDGQPAVVEVGHELPGHDPAKGEQAGVSIHCNVTAGTDGTVRLELGGKVTEIVKQTGDGYEGRVVSARTTAAVKPGETFKLRLSAPSPTEQIWIEAKVVPRGN